MLAVLCSHVSIVHMNVCKYVCVCVSGGVVVVVVGGSGEDRWEMDEEQQHFISHSIQLDRIY